MSLPLFAEKLDRGETVEAMLRHVLSDAKWSVAPGSGNYSHDFAAHNGLRWFLVEVKDESNYQHSERLCIEVQQGRGKKPSGISTSESTVTIHYFGDETILYRTNDMRLHIRAQNGRYKPQPFGQADNHNIGVLVPIFDVAREPWCERISTERLADSRVWSF